MRRSIILDLIARPKSNININVNVNVSSLRHRTRNLQRQYSTSKTTSTPTTTTNNSQHLQPKPNPQEHTQPTNPSAAAGAAIPPLTSNSRSVLDAIKTGPLGRFGSWYSRTQDRRPYATQMASSLIIYLCGDLIAQLLFPSEAKPAGNEEDKNNKETAVVGYDPLRTLRHLAIGLTTSIPQYKWSLPPSLYSFV